MRRFRSAGLGIVTAIAVSATLAATTSAAGPEYLVKGLPEIGSCLKASPKHSGNYGGPKCIKRKAGGKSLWTPAAAGAEHMKLTFHLISPTFQSTGAHAVTISCGNASAAGEYTGEKNFTVGKFVLEGCVNPALSGEKAYCQTTGAPTGEIEVGGLTGEMGFIRQHKSKSTVGFALRGSVAFECEGALEILKKGSGTGTTREIQGSAIGKVTTPLGQMFSSKFAAHYEVAGGAQSPERFERGEKESLTTLVGAEKTAEPTLLTGSVELVNEQILEIKIRCKGC